jgi:hypothetical protein
VPRFQSMYRFLSAEVSNHCQGAHKIAVQGYFVCRARLHINWKRKRRNSRGHGPRELQRCRVWTVEWPIRPSTCRLEWCVLPLLVVNERSFFNGHLGLLPKKPNTRFMVGSNRNRPFHNRIFETGRVGCATRRDVNILFCTFKKSEAT